MADGKGNGKGARAPKRPRKAAGRSAPARPEIVIAVPKGRVLGAIAERMQGAGVDRDLLLSDDRTLVRDDRASGIRFLLLKPDDVPTYVEYGAADLGVVGRDILMEREYDLYAPLDLGIGRCRMVVAGKAARSPVAGTLRVATKFTNIARRHFLARGQQVDVVFVQSSVELAPLTGLADVIVDLVESGRTLRDNGLVELELVSEITSVVIANRVALKLKRDPIKRLLSSLQ
jgi:ATP phosphoribosyltransferase